MAVKIRLARGGKKRNPVYRIVVSDSEFPRDGRYIEHIGAYNPNQDPAMISLNEEKAIKWLKCGAIPTDTVKSILKKTGVLDNIAKEATA